MTARFLQLSREDKKGATMTVRFLVGIKLGEVPDNLVRYSLLLARRAKAEVHLVHFCEPWSATSWTAAYPEGGSSIELAKFAEARFFEQSEIAMRDFVGEVPQDVAIESKVILGSPIEGLEAEAERIDARMIFCGAGPQDSRLLVGGFSTAIGLMASSGRPVMVIPEKAHWRDETKTTFLVCDNLGKHSAEILDEALSFGELTGNASYVHLNVCSVTQRELENMSGWAAEAMTAGLIHHDPEFSVYQTVKKKTENTEHQLRETFFRRPLAAHVPERAYHAVCVNGPVVACIHSQQVEWQADVIVLGRHETRHHNPLAWGKVPLRSMLTLEQPVLLVPPHKRGQR